MELIKKFLFSMLVLIPFSALGAEIATNAPAAVAAAAPAAPTYDSGNTSWLLLSAALVMLMTPGLAFFYAGMVHRKNVVSTLLQNYIALALVGLLWVAIGYSLVFTEGSGFIGGTSAIMLKGLAGKVYTDFNANVPYYAYMAFQMMFAIITPALITGAFAERVNFKAWLFMLISWSLLVYVPVAHWVWGPKGWIANMGAIDFAGGLVVHITAGFSGLVAAFLFGQRYKGKQTIPNDVPTIMLGAALLWFGWFGFNAGSAIVSGQLAAHAFVLTFLGGAAAFIAWVFTDWFITGKPTAVGGATGIVVGLVCITPAAGYVDIDAALIMCTAAGILCNIVSRFVKKISHLDDALDVFTCHGIGAVVGAIMTGAYATKAVNSGLSLEGVLINGDTKLFMANLISVGAVAVYSMVVTYIIIKIINIFTPIKASISQQDFGLDTTMHGEKADN